MAPIIGLLIVLGSALAAAAEGDLRECAGKLPRTLRNELARAYPKAHIPVLQELDAARVAAYLRDAGDGCFAVSRGDFDGDGYMDVGLILATGSVPQLVVALGQGEAWEIRPLATFCASLATCYAETQRAGLYRRAASLDDTPLREGERSTLQSANTVLLSGTLGDTAVAYTPVPGGWAFVQVR